MSNTEGTVGLDLREQIAREGFLVSTTAGMSMYPMLRNRRDRVVILPVGERRLRRYELPLYLRADGRHVLHRVIAVRKDHYIIRGDNTWEKETVYDHQIIGVVSEFYRGERHVLVTSRAYRTYAALWHWIYPMRRALLGVRRLASKIKHAIFK